MEDVMRDDVAYWVTLDECANEGVYCSACHKKVYKLDYSSTMKIRSKFCPNCGRRMVDPGFERLESDVKAILIINEHNKFLSCFYDYKLASVTAIKNNKEGNILLIKYYKVNEKDNFTIRITFDDHRFVVCSKVMFSGKDVIEGLNVNLMRYICDLVDDVIKHCITKNCKGGYFMENEERNIKKPTVSNGGGLKRYRLKLTPLEYLSRSLNLLYDFVEKTNTEYRNDYSRNRDKLVEVNAFGIDLRNGENNAKPYIVLTAHHVGFEFLAACVEITISVTDSKTVYIKERTMTPNGGSDPMVSAYVTQFVGEVGKKFSDIYGTYRSMLNDESERKEESK